MNRYQQLEDNADAAWQRMDAARGTDQFEQLRDAAFAAKDRADDYYRTNEAADTADLGGLGVDGESNHQKEVELMTTLQRRPDPAPEMLRNVLAQVRPSSLDDLLDLASLIGEIDGGHITAQTIAGGAR